MGKKGQRHNVDAPQGHQSTSGNRNKNSSQPTSSAVHINTTIETVTQDVKVVQFSVEADNSSGWFGLSNKMNLSVAMLVLGILVVVLSIVVGVSRGGAERSLMETSSDFFSSFPPSSRPATTGTTPYTHPSTAPSVSQHSQHSTGAPGEGSFSDRFEFLYNLIASDVAETPEVLRNPSAPQHAVLRWLADEDKTYSRLDMVPREKLIERYVLVLLFYQTGVDADGSSLWQRNANFLSARDVCGWKTISSFGSLDIGVECVESHLVTNMDISNNGLRGTIPTEIGLLTAMTSFHLDLNALTGTLPSELGQLTSLIFMHLGNNKLTGTIPTDMGNLVLVQEMFLHENYITGTIPEEFDRLRVLATLSMTE